MEDAPATPGGSQAQPSATPAPVDPSQSTPPAHALASDGDGGLALDGPSASNEAQGELAASGDALTVAGDGSVRASGSAGSMPTLADGGDAAAADPRAGASGAGVSFAAPAEAAVTPWRAPPQASAAALLRRAAAIRQARAVRVPAPAAEPPRPKTHWDFLLEEMKWMANEFAKERKWKEGIAKRIAKRSSNSKLDVESRSKAREKEEHQKLVKRAAFIGREVMRFWAKARQVVDYKIREQVDAIRREKMDKQLELLVGQSEKYSYMLAGRREGAASGGPSAPQIENGSASQAAADPDQSGASAKPATPQQTPQKPTADPAPRATQDDAVVEPRAVEQNADPDGKGPASALQALGGAGASDDEDDDEEGGGPGGTVDSDGENWDRDEEDDEQTLEEEDRAAAAAGETAQDTAVELKSLDRDANLPLEELAASMGLTVEQLLGVDGGGAPPSPLDPAAPSSSRAARPAADEAATPEPPAAGAPQQRRAAPSRRAAAAAAAGAGPSTSRGRGGASDDDDDDDDGGLLAVDRDDASSGGESNEADWEQEAVDDEATLEEEDRLAAEEGGGTDAAGEIKELGTAADLSLEELAANLGLTLAQLLGQDAPPGSPAAEPAQGQAAPEQGAGAQQTPAKPGRTAADADAAAGPSKRQDDSKPQAAGAGAATPPSREAPHSSSPGSHSRGTVGSKRGQASMPPPKETRAAKRVRTSANGHPSPDAPAAASRDDSLPSGPVKPDESSAPAKAATSVAGANHAVSPAPGTSAAAAAHGSARQGAKAPVGDVAVKPDPDAPKATAAASKPAAALKPVVKPGRKKGGKAGGRAALAAADEDDDEGVEDMQLVDPSKPWTATRVPFLLKGTLREYQHMGLDWLVMLCEKSVNGILADEMGLGKTIQTIALLAWLASERGSWGPHLIVVPTSVMLNWEMEFKKFAPAFKVLTYYGNPKERKAKRQGWSKPNAFHVCITSYTLVLQDVKMFKRRRWKYLILDEAHMIKNWKSQRWQCLLNFASRRRLLITGTPLQNDLMELWSLMHFLMPHVFHSHAQFKDWFSNPLTGMVEGQSQVNEALVQRLHSVLRPFILRRLKKDVEKQLPPKHEHVIMCRLSRRQRTLYEDFLSSGSTRETMSSGNFLSIMNVLMQLRKVCNHPDLFEGRPIVSAFDMPALSLRVPARVAALQAAAGPWTLGPRDWAQLGLMPRWNEDWGAWDAARMAALAADVAPDPADALRDAAVLSALLRSAATEASPLAVAALNAALLARAERARSAREAAAALAARVNAVRCRAAAPMLGRDAIAAATIPLRAADAHAQRATRRGHASVPDALVGAILTVEQRLAACLELIKAFMCVVPRARAVAPVIHSACPDLSHVAAAAWQTAAVLRGVSERSASLRPALVRQQTFFPDRRLVQFDCGKLQELAALLRRLKAEGHRVLIFTQMSKMLDILEVFLNLHAYVYMRLDGTTKPEERQVLMTRFNQNKKYFAFILSTRSGGVGINLTGANCVIFYDSDWNPAMDLQAQDRCHRIGQTREVHIYRLVSLHTVEENILRKSAQKRHLDHLAIQSGGFNTAALAELHSTGATDPRELLAAYTGPGSVGGQGVSDDELKRALAACEDADDAAAAVAAEKEAADTLAEFDERGEAAAAAAEAAGEDGEGAEGGADKKAAAAKGETAAQGAAAAAAPEANGEVKAAEDGALDVLATKPTVQALEGSLRPIEKFAVRVWETEVGTPDFEALALADLEQTSALPDARQDFADIEAILGVEFGDDEEAEENLVPDWDRETACKMYRRMLARAAEEVAAHEAYMRQVEAEEARQAERRRIAEEARAAQAAERAYAAAALAPEPLRARLAAGQVADADALRRASHAAASTSAQRPPVVRAPPAVVLPFTFNEDLAICASARALLGSGQALAAGETWASIAAAASRVALQPRSGAQCRFRFAQLYLAWAAAWAGEGHELSRAYHLFMYETPQQLSALLATYAGADFRAAGRAVADDLAAAEPAPNARRKADVLAAALGGVAARAAAGSPAVDAEAAMAAVLASVSAVSVQNMENAMQAARVRAAAAEAAAAARAPPPPLPPALQLTRGPALQMPSLGSLAPVGSLRRGGYGADNGRGAARRSAPPAPRGGAAKGRGRGRGGGGGGRARRKDDSDESFSADDGSSSDEGDEEPPSTPPARTTRGGRPRRNQSADKSATPAADAARTPIGPPLPKWGRRERRRRGPRPGAPPFADASRRRRPRGAGTSGAGPAAAVHQAHNPSNGVLPAGDPMAAFSLAPNSALFGMQHALANGAAGPSHAQHAAHEWPPQQQQQLAQAHAAALLHAQHAAALLQAQQQAQQGLCGMAQQGLGGMPPGAMQLLHQQLAASAAAGAPPGAAMAFPHLPNAFEKLASSFGMPGGQAPGPRPNAVGPPPLAHGALAPGDALQQLLHLQQLQQQQQGQGHNLFGHLS